MSVSKASNIFCTYGDLENEADVEALFVDRLLNKLKYPDKKIKRKKNIDSFHVGRGSKKELYKPDYVLYDGDNKPCVIIDAKSPTENLHAYQYQVSGYALSLNQQYAHENPVRYTILTNGDKTLLNIWDEGKPRLQLSFKEFEEDNAKFVQLRSLISYGAIKIMEQTENVFAFERPPLDTIFAAFTDCHNTIWKEESKSPTQAFREFAKIMFVKLREDQRISKMILEGVKPKPSDFNFSENWIKDQVKNEVDDNPVANILFTRVRDQLEEQIRKGEKKRIFRIGETLDLGLTTIKEVVKKMEHMNLHGIDEDLNGRMFETFLNATVRGKALGQFFTPRSVVKYMTLCSGMTATSNDMPHVLDGCCGSGGFLIEAMAVLVHQIDGFTHLTNKQRTVLKNKLYHDHLWGIDANEDITQIARLNMYLHGDGGSKIFTADSLNKVLPPDKGWNQERQEEHAELRTALIDLKKKFDIILTNPPFSMAKKRKIDHEKKVLEQYDIARTKDGKLASTAKSNILFLERYYDLLEDNGQLITVIDNSVLNGDDSQGVRDWLLERFIIKQVVSLPFNTFFRAQANIQTSILHLKKKEEGEIQGDIFMGILNNIGHNDHQQSTPDRDNTQKLQEMYSQWVTGGKIKTYIKQNDVNDENLGCPFQIFTITPNEFSAKRIDAFFYAPELKELRKKLRQLEKDGTIELKTGQDFHIIGQMKGEHVAKAEGVSFLYFEIGYVTQDGAITKHDEAAFEDLPTRARLQVKTNDVVFAKNNSSRGTTVIIPKEFNNQLVTTGFIGIRPKTHEEACLLWSILESETIRKQIYYLAITAVQPEIREGIFRRDFLIPIPKKEQDKKRLIKNAVEVIQLHDQVRERIKQGRDIASSIFES